MVRKIIIEIARYLLIILFMYAGASKMIGYPQFVLQISLSPLLPSFLQSAAWLIPLVEFGVVYLLLSSSHLLTGLYLSFVLLVLFTFYIVAILTIADHVPCSCGGVLEGLSWMEHLFFNFIFIGVTVLGIGLYQEERLFSEGMNKEITDQ